MKLRPRNAALAFIISVTGACQEFKPSTMAPEKSFSNYLHQSLRSPEVVTALKGAGYATQGAWYVPKLVVAAEATNPGIKKARADLEVARRSIDVARVRPPIGLNFSLERATSGPNPWTNGFTVDLPIERQERMNARVLKAVREGNIAAVDVVARQWESRTQVTLAALKILAAEVETAALGEASTVLETWEKSVSSAARLGEGDRMQELQVARERADLERDRTVADGKRRKGEAGLARAMGIPGEELKGIALGKLPLELPSVPSLREARKLAAVMRYDILRSLAEFSAADATVRLEYSGQGPDLKLGGGPSFDQGDQKWLLSSSLSIPSDFNRAAIAHSLAQRSAALAAFEEVQANALGDVALALADYQASLAFLNKAQSVAVKSRELAASFARLREAGEGSSLITNQQEYLSAREESVVAVARFQAWESLVNLQDSVCVPLSSALSKP